MAGEWKAQSVQALQDAGIVLVEDGNHGEYRPRPDEFSPEGTAFIRAADLHGGHVAFSSASRINPIARARIRKGIGQPGDIILSHKGTVGKLAMAPLYCEPYVCSPQTTFWRVLDETILERRFLYYFMHSSLFVRQLDAVKGETDMADYVSLTAQRRLQVPIPPMDEQCKIASILSALDDKIDLNRRMNETLEAMARAIFKDWFVDFGPTRAKMEGRPPYLAPNLWALFPDRLDEEGKPEGWVVGTLGDVAQSQIRSCQPADIATGTAYIALEHMPRRSIALDQWASADNVESGKLRFRRGEFLFGKLRPYFHKVGIAPVDGVCTTDAVVIGPKAPEWASAVLMLLSSDDFVAFTDQGSTGTKMPRTSWREMARFPITRPTSPLLARAFDHLVKPMTERIIGNVHEAKTLANTRDLLLPKLMSGEIRVREAEGLLGAVA